MYRHLHTSFIALYGIILIQLIPHYSGAQSVYENFFYSNNPIFVRTNTVLTTSNEDFIVVGQKGFSGVSTPNIQHDGVIIKYSKDGRIIKQSALGGDADDMFYDIEETNDGGYLVCGRTSNSGTGEADLLISKFDQNLNILWSKSLGDSGYSLISGYDICQSSDGAYLITGAVLSSFSTTPNRTDIYLIKIDAQGQILWTKTFGISNYDYGVSVSETQNSEYIITGTANFSPFVIKTNSSGDPIWSMKYSGDEGIVGMETNDGQILALIHVEGFGNDIDEIPSKLRIAKLNSNDGQVIWAKEYMVPTSFFGLTYHYRKTASLIKVEDDFVIAGHRDVLPDFNVRFNPFIIKIDANGDLLWGQQYPHSHSTFIHDVKEISDGFIVTGFGAQKGFLLKTDENGLSCNAQSYSPTYEDFALSSTALLEDQSFGGIENNYDLNLKQFDLHKEEFCQVGCENVIIESDNLPIVDNASANTKIETNSIIQSGNSIDYHAGSEILMTPLFEVTTDAIYHAYISPCN